jgi:hypothetical protein
MRREVKLREEARFATLLRWRGRAPQRIGSKGEVMMGSDGVVFKLGQLPRAYVSPLPRLRIGSTLVTKKGVTFIVRDAVVVVASNGGESPSLVLERAYEGRSAEVFMTLGIFANMVRGSMHRPGLGVRIDWARARRSSQAAAFSDLESQRTPTVRRRREGVEG